MKFKFRKLNPREEASCYAAYICFNVFALSLSPCLPVSLTSVSQTCPRPHEWLKRKARMIASIFICFYLHIQGFDD